MDTRQGLNRTHQCGIEAPVPVQQVHLVATRAEFAHQVGDMPPDAGGEGFRDQCDAHERPNPG